MEFYLWCSPRTRGWTIHPPDGAADERVFPAHEVVMVPGREILLGGGNIHCITQQVPLV